MNFRDIHDEIEQLLGMEKTRKMSRFQKSHVNMMSKSVKSDLLSAREAMNQGYQDAALEYLIEAAAGVGEIRYYIETNPDED